MKHYKLDQYFEFTFQTQRFDSGAATDADALPTWRSYEENVDSVVANDNCAKRDDDNTAGYYYARGQITAAAGYEVGKTYEVRAAAAVNSVSGAAVVGRFAVLPANVWDSLYGGTDKLDVNAAEVGGTGQTGHDVGASVNTIVGRILGTIAAGTHNPQSGDAFTRIGAAGAGLTALGDARLANLDAAISSRAAAGDAMTLTAQTIIDLAAAMEAAIINDLDGEAVMQAIADLIASDMTTGDLSVQAIAAATRDVLLDRVLAGNHDLAGTVGQLLQFLDVAVSSRLATSGYTAPDNATISWISSAVTQHRANTEVTLDKLGTMIQLDELSSPQFTANALEQVPKAGYSLATAPPTAGEIKTELEADGGKLDHLWETTEDNAGVRRFSAAALAESPTAAGAFTDEDRAALAAAKAVTDAIATMIVIDGAVYQFTENALELGPAGSGVSFGSIAFALQSTVGAGQVADGSITLYQNAAIAGIVIVVTDEEGDAIDLSAATLVLVVYKDPATVLWSLTEAAGQLTVGGASNNQVTLAANGSYTATPGHYRYALWDTAADLVRARGVLTIEREASAPQG